MLFFGKQATLQLSVCVLKVLVQNHLRLSHPFQVCFAQQITPLIHSKSILRNNSCVLCYQLKPRDYIREKSAAIMWKKTTSLFTKTKGSLSSKAPSTTSSRRHSVSESPQSMEEDTTPLRRNNTLLLGGMRATRSSSMRFIEPQDRTEELPVPPHRST
jgi:hypothetical protein